MIDLRGWLACPACRGALSEQWRCTVCGTRFEAADGIPDLRLGGSGRIDTVRAFYERAPFPGYPPRDSLAGFRSRAERSRFAKLLDRAIAPDAAIAEVGCGTGQMSLFLAHGDRVVIAADLSRRSLQLGAAAAERYGVERVLFVETDLHQSALKPGAFDVVYSSGVVHHTPDPRAAFRAVARLARPGGIVIVGVYNFVARIPLRLRRTIARMTRFRVVPFDPVLRDRRTEPQRYEAWMRDQYRHPEEHSHTVGEVMRWFRENDLEYLRSFPSTVLDDDSNDLFAPAADDWRVERWMSQAAWMATLGREGGLFLSIGQRRTMLR
ncbi:MAG TPA: class I SAM-dependent methyltransferase [Vicinamibacterales bacterium]